MNQNQYQNQQQQAWEQFCKTGTVGDYLAYRTAAVQPGVAEGIQREEAPPYADNHRWGGGAGTTAGGA